MLFAAKMLQNYEEMVEGPSYVPIVQCLAVVYVAFLCAGVCYLAMLLRCFPHLHSAMMVNSTKYAKVVVASTHCHQATIVQLFLIR